MNANTIKKIKSGVGHEIHSLKEQGYTFSQIAKKMGMNEPAVIQRFRNWTSENESLYVFWVNGGDLENYNPDSPINTEENADVSKAVSNLLAAVGELVSALEKNNVGTNPKILSLSKALVDTL